MSKRYDSGSAAKVNETREYTYDELGRLIHTKITNHLQATNNIGNTSYTYDKVGNRIKMVVVDDTTTEYTYNKLNQLLSSISKKKESTTGAEIIVSSIVYTYDANGNQILEVGSVTKETTT